MQTSSNSTLNTLNSYSTSISPLDDFLHYKIISLGKVVVTPGIIILIGLILFFSWLFIRLVKKVLIGKRTEDNTEFGRRYSLFMIVKYIFYVLVFVSIFQVVGISLNALLFSSAALLVGIGMGLQNIFSDLVSGLLLLFERPIELGDVIEVDGVVGKIQVIKLRHTVLVDRDGVNLIVPNHKFVTEKVINWSLNLEERRFCVKVGVAYGSDIKEVKRVLTEIANENSFVIKKNALYPVRVLFMDFGSSSLDFELYFWTRHSFIVQNIQSDMRYRINEEFEKSGIRIPFPQRDIHIRSGEKFS